MKVASDGLSRSCDVVIGAQIDCRNNNNLQSHQITSGGYGADINVPVYATVKGVIHSIHDYFTVQSRTNIAMSFLK